MPQSQCLSSDIPFVAIERPACPKCRAQMMLVSIESVRASFVDLHTFECAVCNQVLKTFAAYEDPMRSKGLGRWLVGLQAGPAGRGWKSPFDDPIALPRGQPLEGAAGFQIYFGESNEDER